VPAEGQCSPMRACRGPMFPYACLQRANVPLCVPAEGQCSPVRACRGPMFPYACLQRANVPLCVPAEGQCSPVRACRGPMFPCVCLQRANVPLCVLQSAARTLRAHTWRSVHATTAKRTRSSRRRHRARTPRQPSAREHHTGAKLCPENLTRYFIELPEII
jgi:hypothetical protein